MSHGMKDPTRPDYTRKEVDAVAKDLTLVHDLLGGTSTMHEKSGTYIRKWKDEDTGVYNIRRKMESVFDGLGRTLSAAVGMLYAKPPLVTWNAGEAEMVEHWDNIDGAGTKGTVFAKRFSDMAVRDGLAMILVDHPAPPVDPETGEPITVTGDNERTLNLRPTWAAYGRRAILNWRTTKLDNETVPSMVVLHEPGEIADGPYGLKPVDRYRVLKLQQFEGTTVAGFVVLEKRKGEDGGDTFPVVGSGVFRNRAGQVANRLPIAIAYAGRTDAPFTADIPLLGVAWSNLRHWQISTDKAFYESLCAFPQPTLVGKVATDNRDPTTLPGDVKIGPMVLVHLQEGGEFKWTELEGSSIERLEQSANTKLTQMAQQGLSFLAPDTRAAETAEAKRLDATAENSTLATAAQGIEDALNMAYQHHAWYLGIPKEQAPMLEISRAYEDTTMPPDVMAVYVKAVKDAGYPPRMLLEAWQQGGRIAPDQDLDELEMEMMANDAASQAAREAEMEVLGSERMAA